MTAGRFAIVLAAGAGARFGGDKLVADWRGAPLIVWAVRAALAARVDGVVAVLGAGADRVRAALLPVADPRLRLVRANNWRAGQSASLKAGLRALPAEAASVAVFLGDMPLVDPADADRLFEALAAGAAAARLLGPRGPAHPAAFSAALFPALLTLSGDEGARALFADLGSAVAILRTENPGAVFDIDRREDLMAGIPLSGGQ